MVDTEKSKGFFDDDDEDISLDIGKVKNIFSKKGKPEKTEQEERKEATGKEPGEEQPVAEPLHEETEEDTEEDEDVSIDLSRIKSRLKSIFAKKEGREHGIREHRIIEQDGIGNEDEIGEQGEEQQAGEVNIDFRAIAGFFKKYAPFILVLIPIILAIAFRLQPTYLPQTDAWSENILDNGIRNQIAAQINQQSPNLPDAVLQQQAESALQDFKKNNREQYLEQLRQHSNLLKDRMRDDSGQTYLLAIDPYFWLRKVENLIDHGHTGDILVNGRPYDTYMRAPLGRFEISDMFHAYFSAYVYRIVSFFTPTDPKNVLFFMPVLISALAIIPAFFLARKAGGNIAGLFAGILIAAHSGFLTRTAAGFADSDAYNVFFPLLIAWVFFEAFDAESNIKQWVLAATAAFITGVYSFSWGGWWYLFWFMLATIGIYSAYYLVSSWPKIRKNGLLRVATTGRIRGIYLIALIYIAGTALFVTLFTDSHQFLAFIRGPAQFSTLQDIGGAFGEWPNVFTTVAEQNVSSLRGVMNDIGGRALYAVAILGILLSVFRRDRHGHRDVKYAIFLMLWLLLTTYAAVKGTRFILMLVPPVALGFGIFIGYLSNLASTWLKKEVNLSRAVISTSIAVFVMLLLVLPSGGIVKSGWRTAMAEMPSMNDAWYSSLEKIDREAAQDAIITSWWDFGHWFKQVADRPVTFDGASQNTPMAHWVGKILLTDDEKLAIGILRMLDCGSYTGFNALYAEVPRNYEAAAMTYDIVRMGREEAYAYLRSRGVSEAGAENVTSLTHCEPPEAYFITSDDMIGKSGVWAHFGSWDFERASMFNTIRKKRLSRQEAVSFITETFNRTEEEASRLFFEVQGLSAGRDANTWIAPWPSYHANQGWPNGLTPCSVQTLESGTIIASCQNGVRFDVTDPVNPEYFVGENLDIADVSKEALPSLLVYAGRGRVETKEIGGAQPAVGIVPDGRGWQSFVSNPALARSMFTVLFFYDGHGLEHFRLFSDETQFTGGRITVWNVSWDALEPNIKPETIPKTEVRPGVIASVDYIAWLENRTVFQSTIDQWQRLGVDITTEFSDDFNYSPQEIDVGAGTAPASFEKRLMGMKPGEVRVFTIEEIDSETGAYVNLTFRARVNGLR